MNKLRSRVRKYIRPARTTEEKTDVCEHMREGFVVSQDHDYPFY